MRRTRAVRNRKPRENEQASNNGPLHCSPQQHRGEYPKRSQSAVFTRAALTG
jgi:hypothetical protein